MYHVIIDQPILFLLAKGSNWAWWSGVNLIVLFYFHCTKYEGGILGKYPTVAIITGC